jgi:hypothetical protein
MEHNKPTLQVYCRHLKRNTVAKKQRNTKRKRNELPRRHPVGAILRCYCCGSIVKIYRTHRVIRCSFNIAGRQPHPKSIGANRKEGSRLRNAGPSFLASVLQLRSEKKRGGNAFLGCLGCVCNCQCGDRSCRCFRSVAVSNRLNQFGSVRLPRNPKWRNDVS